MPYAWTPIAEPRLPPTATMSNPSQLQHQHVNPFSLSLEPPMLYTDLQPIFAEKLTSLYEGCVVITSLKVCHQRVSTCYGCGSSLRENGVLPLPPDDLVMASHLRRKYPSNGEIITSDKPSNVYFKLHTPDAFRCVSRELQRSRLPFTKKQIKLHGEALLHLNAMHKEKLMHTLGLVHIQPFL